MNVLDMKRERFELAQLDLLLEKLRGVANVIRGGGKLTEKSTDYLFTYNEVDALEKLLEKNGYEPGRDFLRDICEPADYDDYKKSWFAIKIDGVCIGIYNTDIEDEIQIGDSTYTDQDEKIPVEIEATEAPYCYELKGDDLHEIDLTKIQGKIEKKLNELAQTGISFSDKIADKAVRKVAVRRVVGVARREAEELKVDSQEREAK